MVKRLRALLTSYTGYSFANSAGKEGVAGVNAGAVFGDDEQEEGGIGKNAWSERIEQERQIEGWIGEIPSEYRF